MAKAMAKGLGTIQDQNSLYKWSIYVEILSDGLLKNLQDEGLPLSELKFSLQNAKQKLKKFYQSAKKKPKEELFSELINLHFQSFSNDDTKYSFSNEGVLICIKYCVNQDSTFNIKQVIIDHFEPIIKLGYIRTSETLNLRLIEIMKAVVEKEYRNNKLSPSGQEERYEHIKKEYGEVKDDLEEIKEVFPKELSSFIDFVYEAKRRKEEQDKERELAREKAEEELLTTERDKPKKKKKGSITKKESKISSKKLEQKSNDIESSMLATSSKYQASSNKKECLKGDKNKELYEELSNLIHLKFPDERSKKFEEEVRQAISKEEKSQQLYKTIIDFHLSRVRYNIKSYNAKYSRHIADTKDKFGTPNFDYQINKFITQNLSDIALTIRSVNSDLQEVFATLDKITPLIYGSQHDQQQSETWLEITGSDTLLMFEEFLAHLENLGEWRNNKLEYVTKNKIRKKSAKPEKENEKRAIEDIELCVKLLASFYDKYISKRKNQPSSQAVEEKKYNISEESTNYDAKTTIATFSQEEFPPLPSPDTLDSNTKHQEWCSLRLTEVEITKLSTELRKCSC